MDRRERLAPGREGGRCAACGTQVPGDNLRILARRDDLVFLEVLCPACGSAGLAIVLASDPVPDAQASIDREASPIGLADVEAVHEFLVGYRGDLRGLFARRGQGTGPESDGGDAHGSAA